MVPDVTILSKLTTRLHFLSILQSYYMTMHGYQVAQDCFKAGLGNCIVIFFLFVTRMAD